MSEKRFFNQYERDFLYKLAGGKCEKCKSKLNGIFHADHIVPYAKGGKTELNNGQILCPTCNSKKGDKMFEFTPRKWQEDSWAAFRQAEENCLISATPGAGKTKFALWAAVQSMQLDGFNFFVVCVPSAALVMDWQNEALMFNLQFVTDIRNISDDGYIGSDYHGIITTYAALGNQRAGLTAAQKINSICIRKKVMSVLDEPHHLGTSLAWSNGTEFALQKSIKRLLITGTPFRSDENPIPYVEYKNTNDDKLISVCAYDYGYGKALADGVVRPIYFKNYDGEASWFENGEELSVSVSEKLSSDKDSKRRRHTLNPSGDWMKEVLIEADNQLSECRKNSDPRSGGLIVTSDKRHAESMARTMRKELNINPVVIVSGTNDESADLSGSELIQKFRRSDDRWVIAVKMISEGIDIRRLRVVVYATNVKTELAFRQIVGRVVRVDKDSPDDELEQIAYAFIPKFPDIEAYADKLKEERAHVIDDIDSWMDEIPDHEPIFDAGDDDWPKHSQPDLFLHSKAEYAGMIFDGGQFSKDEIENMRKFLESMGHHPNNEHIIGALIFQQSTKEKEAVNGITSRNNYKPAKSVEDEMKKYTGKGGVILKAQRKLIELSDGNLSYAHINSRLNSIQKVDSFKKGLVSLSQCKERVRILQEWIENGWQYHA